MVASPDPGSSEHAALSHGFCFCSSLVPALTSHSDGLRPGCLSQIHPFLPRLLLVMVEVFLFALVLFCCCFVWFCFFLTVMKKYLGPKNYLLQNQEWAPGIWSQVWHPHYLTVGTLTILINAAEHRKRPERRGKGRSWAHFLYFNDSTWIRTSLCVMASFDGQFNNLEPPQRKVQWGLG